MLSYTTDQWVIIGLIFVLGLLIGMWLTSGGRRKWKTRYNEEIAARKSLEIQNKEREAHWSSREKEWRDQDSRREAALRDRPLTDGDRGTYAGDRPLIDGDRGAYAGDRPRDRHPDDLPPRRPGDVDGDGVPNRSDNRPADRDRY